MQLLLNIVIIVDPKKIYKIANDLKLEPRRQFDLIFHDFIKKPNSIFLMSQ